MVTPDQFQSSAVAWCGALVVVAGAAIPVVAKIAALSQQVKTLFKTAEGHTADIRSLNEQATATALATPPPSAPVQFPVIDKSGNVSS